MDNLVLFCKSYDRDMLRAKRLAESIRRYNADAIPFFMCVPKKDLDSFKSCFKGIRCTFLTDEEILSESCRTYGPAPDSYPQHLLQQLIKLEFWRMGTCRNYLWLDSDSYFIKAFFLTDFLTEEGVPFTIQHHSEELFDFAATYDDSIIESFQYLASKIARGFNRSGPLYNFGYAPLIWSCKVLQGLYEDFLADRHESIYSLLVKYPCEMQLYGEYLLYSRKIPIFPKSPLFKVYHYAEQFFIDQMSGENDYSLSRRYLGVVMQSNWASPSKFNKKRMIRQKIRKYRKRIKYLFNR